MAAKFEVGSVVQLKHQSILMTVNRTRGLDDDWCECVWHTGQGMLQRENFHQDALERYVRPETVGT
jgi:uncharacterized protein YodC (DUF2158 family)